MGTMSEDELDAGVGVGTAGQYVTSTIEQQKDIILILWTAV